MPLLFLPPAEGGIKCYHLRDYVVQRDGIGNVIQLVARDTVSRGTLPEELQSAMQQSTGDVDLSEKVQVYTHVYRVENDHWESYQEIEGEIIAGTEQQYPLNKSPLDPC